MHRFFAYLWGMHFVQKLNLYNEYLFLEKRYEKDKPNRSPDTDKAAKMYTIDKSEEARSSK